MARRLRAITSVIDGHLARRFGKPASGVVKEPLDKSMSPAIKKAYLLGEALFRESFFSSLEEMKITDIESSVYLWEALVESHKFEAIICERSSLNKHSRALLPKWSYQDYGQRCHILLCCLLHDMHVHEGREVVFAVVGQYVRHFMPTIAKPDTPKTLEEKREKISRLYHVKTGQRAAIKESFAKEDRLMCFRLFAEQASGKRVLLIEVSAKNLKNARGQAYREALKRFSEESSADRKAEQKSGCNLQAN